MYPHLQGVQYTERVRLLSGFAAYVSSGDAGRGRQVTAQTVSTALTAVGMMIALVVRENSTKLVGSDKLLPCLA